MTENEILAAANRGGQQAALVALVLYFVLSFVVRVLGSVLRVANPLTWVSGFLAKLRMTRQGAARVDSVGERVQDQDEPPVLHASDDQHARRRGSW